MPVPLLRPRRLLHFVLWLCAISLAVPTALHAAEHLAGSTAPGTATNKFEEGKQAFLAGRFLEALRAFQASSDLEPSPNTRFQIAKCYVALGKTASAYSNFRRAAQEAEDRVNATHEKRYAATREAALIEAKALDGKVPRLTVVTPAKVPDGFHILLDGNEVAQPAWNSPLEVDPGPHELVATGNRMQRHSARLELMAGDSKRLEIPVTVVPTAILQLVLRTKPAGLAISLDDQALSPEQVEKPLYVDVGSHKLLATAPGYSSYAWTGFVQNKDEPTITILLKVGGSGPPKWATFVVGGAALVAICVGIGLGVQAQNMADDQQMLVPLLRDPDVRDSVRTYGIGANVAYGIGGLLAINTVILAATTKWRDSSPGKKSTAQLLRFTPVLSNQALQFSLSGRFE